jgi:hypothetical protein
VKGSTEHNVLSDLTQRAPIEQDAPLQLLGRQGRDVLGSVQ